MVSQNRSGQSGSPCWDPSCDRIRGGQYLKYLYFKHVFEILFVFGIWYLKYCKLSIWYFGILNTFLSVDVFVQILHSKYFSKYFQHTFNMLLQATMLKPVCIVGAVNFSGSHLRVAFVKGCGTNEESDWFNNFIFNFNRRNW